MKVLEELNTCEAYLQPFEALQEIKAYIFITFKKGVQLNFKKTGKWTQEARESLLSFMYSHVCEPVAGQRLSVCVVKVHTGLSLSKLLANRLLGSENYPPTDVTSTRLMQTL